MKENEPLKRLNNTEIMHSRKPLRHVSVFVSSRTANADHSLCIKKDAHLNLLTSAVFFI